MDILSVIQKHGHTTHSLAKEIGVKQSTLMGMIKGNPTISTLRKLSDALKCPVAEFFADELAEAGFSIVKTAAPKRQDDGMATAEETRVLRFQYDCPHCGESVKITIEKS